MSGLALRLGLGFKAAGAAAPAPPPECPYYVTGIAEDRDYLTAAGIGSDNSAMLALWNSMSQTQDLLCLNPDGTQKWNVTLTDATITSLTVGAQTAQLAGGDWLTIYSRGPGTDAIIARHAAATGALVWAKTLSAAGFVFGGPFNIVTDGDDIYVQLLGASMDFTVRNIVVKLDADGAILWDVPYATATPGAMSIPRGLVAQDATGIYEMLNSQGDANRQIVVKRSKATGLIVWQREVTVDNYQDAAVAVNDDAVIFVHSNKQNPDDFSYTGFTVVAFDKADGTPLSHLKVADPGGQQPLVTMHASGHAAVVAVPGFDPAGIHILLIDTSGGTLTSTGERLLTHTPASSRALSGRGDSFWLVTGQAAAGMAVCKFGLEGDGGGTFTVMGGTQTYAESSLLVATPGAGDDPEHPSAASDLALSSGSWSVSENTDAAVGAGALTVSAPQTACGSIPE